MVRALILLILLFGVHQSAIATMQQWWVGDGVSNCAGNEPSSVASCVRSALYPDEIRTGGTGCWQYYTESRLGTLLSSSSNLQFYDVERRSKTINTCSAETTYGSWTSSASVSVVLTLSCVSPQIATSSGCQDPVPEQTNPCEAKKDQKITLTWSGSLSSPPGGVATDRCGVTRSGGLALCLKSPPDNCVAEFKYTGSQLPADDPSITSDIISDSGKRETVTDKPVPSTSETNLPQNSICDSSGNCTVIDVNQKLTTTGDTSSITWDDVGVTATTQNGSTTSTTTTKTTNNYTDGSKMVTTTTNVTNNFGGSNTFGSTYGGSGISSSTNPTSTSNEVTQVDNYDSNGNLVSSTITGSVPGAEQGPLKIDETGTPSPNDNAFTGKLGGVDDFVSGITSTSPNQAITNPVSFGWSLGGGGACTSNMFSLGQFHGVAGFTFDLCPSINMLRELLYWFFYALTGIYVFNAWSTAHRGV